MFKQISHRDLAEIVTALLVKPELLGELDTVEKHQEFMLAIGHVVADHCGGQTNWINPADVDEEYLSDQYSSPYLSVSPNENLPSLERNVWAYHDPDGWEGMEGLSDEAILTNDEIQKTRNSIQQLLIGGVD